MNQQDEYIDRFRVEPTSQGYWGYCVKAGTGTRELFVGHKKQCEQVAALLLGAFTDGQYAASQSEGQQDATTEGAKFGIDKDLNALRELTKEIVRGRTDKDTTRAWMQHQISVELRLAIADSAMAMLKYVLPHIPPRAIDPQLARTRPMEDAYINTIVRHYIATVERMQALKPLQELEP